MDSVSNYDNLEGVAVVKLRTIETQGGSVLHMLRCDTPLFRKFGEIYFSEVFPGAVKAWKRHQEMTQHFAVPIGRIRVVLFDDRKDSKTNGMVNEYVLGRPDNYILLRIPPMLWYGFSGISDDPAIVANCTDIPHDPKEAEQAPVDDPRFPYDWRKSTF